MAGAQRAPNGETRRPPKKRRSRRFETRNRNGHFLAARKRLGLSQEDLARATFVKLPTVQALEFRAYGRALLQEDAGSVAEFLGVQEYEVFPYSAWRCSSSYAAASRTESPPPDELMIIEEERRLTREAIPSLPPRLRVPLCLSLCGLFNRRIGDLLGFSGEYARQQVDSATALLRFRVLKRAGRRADRPSQSR